MKIRVYRLDEFKWEEADDEEEGGELATEVEVPDLLVREWRRLTVRLKEIEDYIEGQVGEAKRASGLRSAEVTQAIYLHLMSKG